MAVFGGHVGPASLLLFTFLVGSGMALFGPSWQASVGEQVTPALLPSAIALNSVSFNIARSFGPAVGGVIVAWAGVAAAFIAAAVCYLPLIRSEERRVGKEGVSTCRSRGWQER